MAFVKAQPGQTNDQVIRAFQKKVLAEDIVDEIKKRQYYEKPAIQRKNKALLLRHSGRRRTY